MRTQLGAASSPRSAALPRSHFSLLSFLSNSPLLPVSENLTPLSPFLPSLPPPVISPQPSHHGSAVSEVFKSSLERRPAEAVGL